MCSSDCLSCAYATVTVEFLPLGLGAPKAVSVANSWDRKTKWPISRNTSLETNLMSKLCLGLRLD